MHEHQVAEKIELLVVKYLLPVEVGKTMAPVSEPTDHFELATKGDARNQQRIDSRLKSRDISGASSYQLRTD